MRIWSSVALLASSSKLTAYHLNHTRTQAREFLGIGSFALTQFRHADRDYTYVMICIEPLKREQIKELQGRCDRMGVQFGWGRYVD